MMSVFVSFLVIIIAISAYFYRNYSSVNYFGVDDDGSKENRDSMGLPDHSVCFDSDFVQFLQRKQWKRAKIEVFGSKERGFTGSDMDFYLQPFGMSIVNLTSTRKKLSSSFTPGQDEYDHLVYYRIWKNGNSNIRSLLFQYAYMADKFFSSENKRNFTFSYSDFLEQCSPDEECNHPDIEDFAAEYMKSYDKTFFNNTQRRYYFTYARNPIDRFISGMTEVEYLMKKQEKFLFPFKHNLDQMMRIAEFIDFILLSGGSKNFFQNFKFLEILHIFPMIGTLLIHEKIEKYSHQEKLHVFKLEESFDSTWKQLSNELFPYHPYRSQVNNNQTIPEVSDDEKNYLLFPNNTFYHLYHQRRIELKDWRIHLSSKDPLKTTKAAKQFFSFASFNAFQRYSIPPAIHLIFPLSFLVGRFQPTTSLSPESFWNQKVPRAMTLPQTQKLARNYYRALCRIYFIDFICFNYSLPFDCSDLHQEFQDDWQIYQKKLRKQANQQNFLSQIFAVF